MLKFPRPLQLMEVLGTEMVEVFLEHFEQLQTTGEQRFVGRVMGADTANIFIHDLFKTLQAMQWQQVARRNGSCDDLVAANRVILQGLEDDLFEAFVLRLTDLRCIFAKIVYVFDRRLAGNSAFSE